MRITVGCETDDKGISMGVRNLTKLKLLGRSETDDIRNSRGVRKPVKLQGGEWRGVE